MNKLIQLTLNDLKNITRDDILKYFFIVVPILFILILVLIIPLILNKFPDIANYESLIITFFSLELPMIIGFVISFLMLDEKDERVFTALRVMPVSLFQFLFYRLFFAVFFSFLFISFMLFVNGLIHLDIASILINSFNFALITPIVVLLEVTFAGNKVTGFTMFKGINFVFILPVASVFIRSKWMLILTLIPTYWPIKSTYNALEGASYLLNSIISIGYSFVVILILSIVFKKKVYYQ